MLFAVIYRFRDRDEAADRRAVQLFSQWTPPAELEFKAHYSFAVGGGVAICDAPNAAVLHEALAPWLAFQQFELQPVVDIAEAVPIWQRMNDWRDSIRLTSAEIRSLLLPPEQRKDVDVLQVPCG